MHSHRPLKLLLTLFCIIALSGESLANHPVLVEGESDFDGDGLLGFDENLDGDRIFGTLGAALAADLGAINNNGKIAIVTSGRFAESLLITGANGNVTLEAAPGVAASIDAVLAGVSGNVERQSMSGIAIDSGANRSIILRNLTVRNWRVGIAVEGDSRVVLDNVHVEQNLDYGILVSGSAAHVAVTSSQVIGTGFRVGAAGNSPDVDLPDPGVGIRYENGARGVINNSSSIGNFASGFEDRGANVQKKGLVLFNNEY